MSGISLDAIQARADAATDEQVAYMHFAYHSSAHQAARQSVADVPALLTADYEPEDGLVCNECSTFETTREWPCETVRAITAHIDTTPKETDR